MAWNKEDCRLVLLYVGHSKEVTPFKTHFHAFFKTPSSNIFLRTGLFVCSHENGKTTGCQLCEGWMWNPRFCFLFWFQLKEVEAFWSDISIFSSVLSIFFTQERLLWILDLRDYNRSWIGKTTIDPDLKDYYRSWIWKTTIDPGFERLLWILDLRDYNRSWIWETTMDPGFERLL